MYIICLTTLLLILFETGKSFRHLPFNPVFTHRHAESIESIETNEIPAVASTPVVESRLRPLLTTDFKIAMKNKDKLKLKVVVNILSAIKQKEIDERVTLNDDMIVQVMLKLLKKSRETIKSCKDNGRVDLIDTEQKEMDVLLTYMPPQLSPEEVLSVVHECIQKTEAKTMKDMLKVINELRPRLEGRTDTSQLGELVRGILTGKTKT